MKLVKKHISILLTIVMLLGLLPGTALAADNPITDMSVSTDTDLSGYTSPDSWVTLTVPANTTVTLSGSVSLNKVHLDIGAGSTVTLSGVKLLGKDYKTSDFTVNTPTVSGAADSALILTKNAQIRGSKGFLNGSDELKLAPTAAVSGVGKIILSASDITGGDLGTQDESYSRGEAASAIVDATEVYSNRGDILCGKVTVSTGSPGADTAPAIVATGNLTYYTNGGIGEVSGTAIRLYRLQATNATLNTAEDKTITIGSDEFKLYAAATSISATNGTTGGDWIVKNGSGALVDIPAISGDSPTFTMPEHDLSVEGIAAIGAEEVTGGTINALTPDTLNAVLGAGNYETAEENGVTVIKLTKNLSTAGAISFEGVTCIFDLNGHAIKGKPGEDKAGGIGVGGYDTAATVLTLRATGGGSVTGESGSGYAAVNLSAKNTDDKLTIEGGTYTGVGCAALAAGSPDAVVGLEISGGTFNGGTDSYGEAEDGLYFAYGGVDGVITGGTFSSAYLKAEAEYGEKWAISGGTFVDELTCGQYSGNAVSGLLAPGYTFQVNGVDATTDQLAGHTLTGRVTVVSATPPVDTTDTVWTTDGTTYSGSGTLAEAITAMSSATDPAKYIVKLQKSITDAQVEITAGAFALDLNGQTLGLGSAMTIAGASTHLTVQDTTTSADGKITFADSGYVAIALRNSAMLTLKSGILEHTNGSNIISSTAREGFTAGGLITIDGGIIRQFKGNSTSGGNAVYSAGGILMTGGRVESDDDSPNIVAEKGIVQIKGGTSVNTGGASALITVSGATAEVSGGTLTGSGAATNCYAVKTYGTLKLSGSPVLSGQEATLYTKDGASIIANISGTPYSGTSGTAATVFYQAADQSADDVLVSGLTDAEHAKLFTPNNIKVGFTSEYDNASTSLKIKTATADTYYLKYSTGDSFYVTMSGFTSEGGFMMAANPEVGTDYTFTISTLDANHSLPTAIEIDRGGNYLALGTDYTYNPTSGVVVIKANQVEKGAQLIVKANGEITTAAQLQAAVGGSTVATVSGNKVTMTAASTIATEERLILRGNFTLDLDAFALTFSNEKSNITINPTGALTLSGTTGGLTAHAVVSVGTSLTITSGSYYANVITADGMLTITGGTLAKGVQVYGMTGGKPTATISGGTFTDTAHGVMLYGGTLNINGGTFQKLTTAGNTGMSKLSVSGGSFASYGNEASDGTQTLADGIKAGSKVYKYDNNTKGEELAGTALNVTSYASPFMVETPSPAPVPTVGGTSDNPCIYANGAALIIAADAGGTGTTVYIDTDGDGVKDDIEKSLKEASITSAPENGADLSKYTVYGGTQNTALTGNTKITMTGGTVYGIYGGGWSGSVSGSATVTLKDGTVGGIYGGGNQSAGTTGSTAIYINGGLVDGRVYGGGGFGAITGDTAITMTDGKVKYHIYGGGSSGSVGGSTDIHINGGWAQNVYGGGSLRAVTGNTAITMTAGEVDRNVYGGGYKGAVTGTAAVTLTGGKVGVNVYGGVSHESATVGGATVTVGGSAKVGYSSFGVVINGTGVTNGVASFKIDPNLADGAAVNVCLPEGYTIGTIATESVVGDLAKIKLVGSGATNRAAYFEGTEIKVKETPPVHVPVTGITGVPTTATAGTDLTLTGTVAPATATNTTIVWSVKSAGATGATIAGTTLSTTAAGTVTVTATITNGATASTNYTKDFTITVEAKPAPHVCNGMTFEPWSNYLPDNSYFSKDMTGNIVVQKGKTLNLCLNGHSLTAQSDGSAITVAGTLNLYDCNGSNGSHTITVGGASHTITGGLITGGTGKLGTGWGTSGGGVYIEEGGSMTLYDGTIAGNTAIDGAGGGVYVVGTFTMEGGSISYNTGTSTNGGGLCVGGTTSTTDGSTTAVGTAILNGGTISHNTVTGNGGGVRVTGGKLGEEYTTLTLSGTVIVNNTAGVENGIHSNGKVILDADCGIQSITGLGAPIALKAPLTGGSMISLSPDTSTPERIVVTGATAGDLARIKLVGADAAPYELKLEGTDIWLRTIPTYEVSGGVEDETGGNVENATVKLMLGYNQVGTTQTTGVDGTFVFDGVPNGVYNLVTTKDGVTVTTVVEVKDTDNAIGKITLPTGKLNTKIEVEVDAPAVVADGLGSQISDADREYAKIPTNAVEIKLVVKDKQSGADASAVAAKITADGLESAVAFDLSLVKTMSGATISTETVPVATSPLTLRVPIPAAALDKAGYKVYRSHDGSVDVLTAAPNADGEKIEVVDSTLILTVKKFSTYAIAYTEPAVTPPPVNPGYTPNVPKPENGSVTLSPANPLPGQAVTVTPKPDTGFIPDKVTVTDKEGNEVPVKKNPDGSYTYTQPGGSVTIEVSFKPADPGYTDVSKDDWFYDSVVEAYKQGLMVGTSDGGFSPYMDTSRGMIVTILWRLEGKPSSSESSAFTDVSSNQYYAEAISWAAEHGIVAGYDSSRFGPEDPITREQLAAILWRYAKYKGLDVTAGDDLTSFTDAGSISDYALSAMKWAVAEGLIQGKDEGRLDPLGKAIRAEAAAVLVRLTGKVLPK